MDTETYDLMVSGAWYDPSKLSPERVRAQTACADYNALRPLDMPRRTRALRSLLGALGEGVVVEQPFRCDYGRNIALGERTFLNYGCVMLDCAPITLGRHVLVGPGCHFYTAIHPIDPLERMTDRERAEPIAIGDNVWLGGHVTVLPGVTIGENTVVGAGSVVTRSLPANVVAVGNPARVVRELPAPNLRSLDACASSAEVTE